MTVNTIRWMVIDTVHHRTGIKPPSWDFFHLRDSALAFGMLIDIHYKYYLFHSNTLVSLIWVYLARRWSLGFWTLPVGWADAGFLILATVFFLGSRDALQKYYARTGQLLAMREADGKDGTNAGVRS